MSAEIEIQQGLDLPMLGAPAEGIRRVEASGTVSVYPGEYTKLKFKLLVKEGDTVVRGGELARRKDLTDFVLRSPVAGTVTSVILGERRALQEIVIEPGGQDEAHDFGGLDAEGLLKASREDIVGKLTTSGLLALVRQRPFDHIADPSVSPKSIFVNAMATAPFRPDPEVLARGKADVLQAGLNALTRLTDGPVHLCMSPETLLKGGPLSKVTGVSTAAFSGPHPSGNTSTHIHYLDPIVPGDTVWTLRLSDVLRIGEFLTTGAYPSRQLVMVAGEGAREEMRGYVDAPQGLPLSELLAGVAGEDEVRVIRGDVLAGESADPTGSGVEFYDQGFVLLPEDRERHLLGWYAPTTDQYSAHKVVPSAWIKDKLFSFGTSTRGSKRAMVLTGIYDKYTPLDIMVDPLSRACIANETEEAIDLGILETVPEDFALCTFVCPSKTDFGAIVAETLNAIEAEGI